MPTADEYAALERLYGNGDTTDEGDDGRANGNAEAARWRRRLRDTETERDALAERLTAMRRREVERLAGETLNVPGDVWTFGAQLEDLLDADGHVDPAKVSGFVAGLVKDRPGLDRRWKPPVVDLGQGRRALSAPSTPWSDVLRGR